jgi:NitT/TauT family transport system ATP-binding protein
MNRSIDQPASRVDNVIDLEKVGVAFGASRNLVTALAETSLRISHGEFIALVGPSGCVNIRDNVMLPLKIVPPFKQAFAKKRKSEYRDRVEASLARVGLAGFGDKFPWQLSGGMQQRASLCRALIHDPTLLLLDEPFGALDQFTREELWEIMQNLWIEKRPTVLLVTHDLKEAAYLASRICVMQARPGRIVDDSMVPFARPRTIEISFEPEFVSLTQRLRERIVAARAVQEIAS